MAELREKRKYQRCSCCVMDTSDSKIVFDEKGVCDYCNDYYKNILPGWKAKPPRAKPSRSLSAAMAAAWRAAMPVRSSRCF